MLERRKKLTSDIFGDCRTHHFAHDRGWRNQSEQAEQYDELPVGRLRAGVFSSVRQGWAWAGPGLTHLVAAPWPHRHKLPPQQRRRLKAWQRRKSRA